MKKLTVGSCFSGIGGIELGLERTGGFETKWQIENDEYASRVLAKHWPAVKRYSDIRDVVRPESVDLICGGFPCQDVSLAGKRAGFKGKRSSLWREMFRLVCEVRPQWVVAENVPGLLSSDGGGFMGYILRDLARAGYDAEWGVLSAAGVGAPHLRRRLFVIAYSSGSNGRLSKIGQPKCEETSNIGNNGEEEFVAHAPGPRTLTHAQNVQKGQSESRRLRWWDAEPNVGRVAHGVPSRVDRLRCLGNAVVPQVAEKIGRMIHGLSDVWR